MPITSQTLLSMGFSGKKIGELMKASKEWNRDEIAHFLITKEKPHGKSVKLLQGTVWHWLCTNPVFQGWASNSEKRRWIESKSVQIDDQFPEPDDLIYGFRLHTLVFFPKGNSVTMLGDNQTPKNFTFKHIYSDTIFGPDHERFQLTEVIMDCAAGYRLLQQIYIRHNISEIFRWHNTSFDGIIREQLEQVGLKSI